MRAVVRLAQESCGRQTAELAELSTGKRALEVRLWRHVCTHRGCCGHARSGGMQAELAELRSSHAQLSAALGNVPPHPRPCPSHVPPHPYVCLAHPARSTVRAAAAHSATSSSGRCRRATSCNSTARTPPLSNAPRSSSSARRVIHRIVSSSRRRTQRRYRSACCAQTVPALRGPRSLCERVLISLYAFNE